MRPTNNVGVRRAMLAAIDQKEAMLAAMGEDPADVARADRVFRSGHRGRQRRRHGLRAQAAHGGRGQARCWTPPEYNGERLVFMHPTDQVDYNAFSTVVVDAFRKVGLNVDEQMTDWGTVVQRRPSKEPLDKGGWSMFPPARRAANSSIRCWPTRCAATAPRRGSAGRTIRRWRRLTRPGSTRPTTPSATGRRSRSSPRRSSPCRAFRWGTICRTRRGDRM